MDHKQIEIQFDDLLLDTGQRAVFRDAIRLSLTELDFELLQALVLAAPAAVSHQQLIDAAWQGRVVAPETVTQRIKLIRAALGDSAGSPRYIRTLRGFGYQLVPAVTAKTTQLPVIDFGHRDTATQGELTLPSQPSIVVLPFSVGGSDDRAPNLAFGLCGDVTSLIARTRSFFVIARATALRFVSLRHELADIGQTLGVRYVVQGHLSIRRDRYLLQVILTDAVSQREIWNETFTDSVQEFVAARDKLASAIVGVIDSEVSLAEQHRALAEPAANLDAWSAYHRGYWHMFQFTPSALDRAEHWFDLATRLDPAAARPYAGLSWVHWQRAFLGLTDRADDTRQLALENANRSTMLDRRDPLAHWALGRAHLLYRELDTAITELQHTAELNPSFAVGRYSLSFAQLQAGTTEQSFAHAAAAERLSPYDPLMSLMIGTQGFCRTLDSEFNAGADLMERAVQQPNTHYQLFAKAAVACALADRQARAQQFLAKVRESQPDYRCEDFLRSFDYRKTRHIEMIKDAFGQLNSA